MVGSLLVGAGLLFAGGSALALPADDGPHHIVGGQEAGNCEWPSVVSILEDDETPVMCTGTLVHPNVVTTAAHCITAERPVVAVGFGEEGQGDIGPQRSVGVIECVGHPQYYQQGYPDIAYCMLAQPVTDVPIVPLLAGCEVDFLQPGDEVTIVGYGASYGTYNEDTGEVEATGVGPKRWITQTVDVVSPGFDEVDMVGGNGSQSACFGDSGGPALVELADGTWRVFGAASRLYNPGGFPPPEEEDNVCGTGVTYGFLSTQMDWLETETGTDLTPCYDDDGSWNPTAGCVAFPTAPGVGNGAWVNGCAGGPTGDADMQCEDPIDPSTTTSTTSGGSSSGDDSDTFTTGDDTGGGVTTVTPPMTTTTDGTTSTSGPLTTTGPVTAGPSSASSGGGGADDSGDEGDADDDGNPENAGTDTDTDGADQNGLSGRGCACDAQSTSGGPGSLGAGLLMLGLFSLRRRSSR